MKTNPTFYRHLVPPLSRWSWHRGSLYVTPLTQDTFLQHALVHHILTRLIVDYNSWIESDKARRLRTTLDPDTVLAEGYKEYDTGRTYLVSMGDWRKNKDEEVDLDGIGGVNILVKADVHRSGINFPAYAFENQAETEGFAKMAKRAGYQVVGLPNYVVWHIDTDEKPGNLGNRKAY